MVSEPKYVQYGDLCSLGKQVYRLLEVASRERVKFLLLEDISHDAGAVYRSVLQFLGVNDDDRRDFRAHNQAKTRRWHSLVAVAWAVSSMKRTLGISANRPLAMDRRTKSGRTGAAAHQR